MTSIPTSLHIARAAPAWSPYAAATPPLPALAERAVGEVVTNHRTSFVRRLATPSGAIYIKVYEYLRWADRLRDFGRRTGPFATPRAVREYDALVWLATNGFDAPTPLLAAVQRHLGFVVRAVLVTAAWPGEPAERVLPTLDAPRRIELVGAIERLLGALHARGFRDRNFDLRNLLVARAGAGWRIAKLDSPRFELVPPTAGDDALARADRARLAPQLAPFRAPA